MPEGMTTSPSGPPRADWRFVRAHPAHFIAFGFGAGLSPFAPGTAGTLLGFPLYALLARLPGRGYVLVAVALVFALGVWAAGKTASALGVADHGGICFDEIAAFLLILVFTPPSIAWFIAAFFVFRFFDVVKPYPIRYVDRKIKNGFGVMFDDMLAAGYSVLVLKLGETLIHG